MSEITFTKNMNKDTAGSRTPGLIVPQIDEWALIAMKLGEAGIILTTTPLALNAHFGRTRGLVKADKAGTLYLEESEDNSTWTTTATVTVTANAMKELPWTALVKHYFRFHYINGATAQTSFSLIQQVSGLEVERVELTGSNFDKALNTVLPANAILQGLSDGINIQAMRGNTEDILLALAARTALTISSNVDNINARGVQLILYVTAAGTGNLQVGIQGIDSVAGPYYLTTPATAITVAGTYVYDFYPGSTAAAAAAGIGVAARYPLEIPKTWRTVVLHADASSWTYSLNYKLVV